MSRVIAELIVGGVGEFVLCGGARNAFLVAAAVRAAKGESGVRVWQQFDERSAGFFALGRTMATGAPVCVIVTSGTAVGELLPAVMEAHYQGRPLVLVTADRPEAYRGTGAPQAVEQEGIFGVYARICDYSDWDASGPLHLNICLEENEVEDDLDVELGIPQEPQMRFQVGGLARFLREDIFRGLVVMVGGLDLADREEVYHFCRALGVPVVADGASGIRELLGKQLLPDPDALLLKRPPAKILRLGEVPVGRFWRDLEDLKETAVFSICRTGMSGLARESEIVQGPVARVLRGLGEVEPIGDVLDHLRLAGGRRAHIDELLEAYPASEPSLIRQISILATTGQSVFLGNSLPVREWGSFAQVAVPYDEVRAMRGANGIDGQVSAWLGASADEEESWSVLGDLTTLYDVQGVAFAGQVGGKKVLVVVNNGGGRIFDRLPRLDDLAEVEKSAVVQSQSANFEGLAQLWGVSFIQVKSDEDLDRLDDLGDGFTLVEVLPSVSQTQEFWSALVELRNR